MTVPPSSIGADVCDEVLVGIVGVQQRVCALAAVLAGLAGGVRQEEDVAGDACGHDNGRPNEANRKISFNMRTLQRDIAISSP
jgi:hypothetical protein